MILRKKYYFHKKREEKPETDKICDYEGCNEPAYFKAPKDRTLKNYYWFCEKHIKEYNENWDFCKGLSEEEIEKEIVKSYVWDRPTYKFGSYNTHKIFSKAANFFDFFIELETAETKKTSSFEQNFSVPVDIASALKVMGLKMPITESSLKIRYKELAKTHHPDLNSGNKESEELFKQITVAYHVLLRFLA